MVISYEKRGNSENYIKEAKYDMSLGHLLLKSFWANEAMFQMMMLSYNLFLLFKFDCLSIAKHIQTANKDISFEAYISGCKNNQNCPQCNYEIIVWLSIQGGIWKMFNLKQLTVDLEDAYG